MTTYAQTDIESLSAKLNALSDSEKAALADVVARGSVEVQGFTFAPTPQADFASVQWVFSPATPTRFEPDAQNTITVQICHQ